MQRRIRAVGAGAAIFIGLTAAVPYAAAGSQSPAVAARSQSPAVAPRSAAVTTIAPSRLLAPSTTAAPARIIPIPTRPMPEIIPIPRCWAPPVAVPVPVPVPVRPNAVVAGAPCREPAPNLVVPPR